MSAWKLFSNWGSLRSGDPDASDSAFHAGHVNDALRLNIAPYFPTLVASDSSGVWLANEFGGPAIPLSSSWDSALHLNCLSPGIYSDQHVYAAGDALYETDTTKAAPLLNWRRIPIQKDGENALNAGEIHRVIVVRERSKIVLACDGGVFWATIQSAGGNYSFQQVTTLPGQRYSGLAEGIETKVIAGAWGSDLKKHCGIFVGDWTGPGGSLVFKPASITGSINRRKMLRTEIAACASDRMRLYAVCGGGGGLTPKLDGSGNPLLDGFGDVQWNGDDLILSVLRSKDGGLTWEVAGSDIIGSSTDKLFGRPKDVIGHTQFGYNICVGVSPFDPKLVAVGIGGFAISKDGGNSWQLFADGSAPHLHADTHGLVFDQTDPAHIQLLICSDGGLASTPDLGKTFATGWNRQFPNFQFFRFAPSFQNSGLVGGSLQDNGDVYTNLYINVDPWKDHDGGDGILMMFIQSGHLIHHNNTSTGMDSSGTLIEYGSKARIAQWDDSKRAFSDLKLLPSFPLSLGVIPVDATGDGLVNQNRGEDNIIEIVDVPTWVNASGQPMLAVAGESEVVFGLFGDGSGNFIWNQLANVPHLPDKDATGKELPYFARAVACRDGNAIWVGMDNGKVFRLDAPGFTAKDLSIPGNKITVARFAITPTRVFAIAGSKVFRHDGSSWTDVTNMTPLPTSPFSALTVDHSDPRPQVFIANSSKVWASADEGATWYDTSAGLPSFPQINDLRVVTEASGAEFLYAGTFGWSAFRRLLNFDEVLKPITVSGHMDIVDRVAVGHDIWSHPTISNTLQLGPLHPFEKAEYTEDDGDEVQVVLKLKFQWHIDFSVTVDYDATLIAKDEDNAVDDHTSGSLTVPFSTTKQQIIDLASDELWPDRAHIEINVANP